MVQIIENWSVLSGEVRSTGPSAKKADLCELEVAVDRADEVEGFPNLLADAPGTTVRVIVPRAAVERAGLTVGSRVVCRARKATPFEVFAQPDSLVRRG